MKNDKNLTIAEQFKTQTNIPKTYEQFLLEEQQNQLTEQDQRITESYQTEYEAEVSQGSQYGPGKGDFRGLFRRITNYFGGCATGRISCDSDSYVPGNDYAGAIIYTINGNHTWTNRSGSDRSGRSFYIIIKCTNYWPRDAFGSFGEGAVHGYLIQQSLGYDLGNYSDKYSICGGGFAYYNGTLSFRSAPLNGHNSGDWPSDGSRDLSPEEKELVRYCWNKYISLGPSSTFQIPPLM